MTRWSLRDYVSTCHWRAHSSNWLALVAAMVLLGVGLAHCQPPPIILSVEPPDAEGTYYVTLQIRGLAANSLISIRSEGVRATDGGPMEPYSNSWGETDIRTDDQGNVGVRVVHKEWGRYTYFVRDEQRNLVQGTIEYDQGGRVVQGGGRGGGRGGGGQDGDGVGAQGSGVTGTWIDGDGDRWQIGRDALTITRGNQVLLQGSLKPDGQNRYIVNERGNHYRITIHNASPTQISLTIVMPDGQRQDIGLRSDNGGGGNEGGGGGAGGGGGNEGGGGGGGCTPAGGEYLTYLYADSMHQPDQWYHSNGSPVNFEGRPCANSYRCTLYSGGRGAFSLADLKHAGRPRLIDVTLAVSDETDPETSYLFQIRLDAQSPREWTVRLRQGQHVQLNVEGVGRVEFTSKRLTGDGGEQLLVEPRVYY